ncbi:MAG: DMT family transporter [Rhizobiales bacterium]|nr:DMT family transporter [Hyphomicrobiales bacterium]
MTTGNDQAIGVAAVGHQDTSANARLGIFICIVAMACFACMDAMTKLVIHAYSPPQFLMVRYWAFALCAVVYVSRTTGLKQAMISARPGMQFIRSIVLVLEANVMAFAFAYLGLAEVHAVFAVYPLLVTIFAAVLLGENVGWRRRLAVLAGFAGALLIIEPGLGAFNAAIFIPLAGAALFAAYHIVTRFVAGADRFETSFLFMAVIGALAITPMGIMAWKPLTLQAAWIISLMAVLGIVGHLLLVKALALANASTIQPFNFFLLAWATLIGTTLFGERPDALAIGGTILIVAAGLFTIMRERVAKPAG